MNSVRLTDDELTLLDGKCSDEVQAQVDAAKLRLAAVSRLSGLTPQRAGFVADVVREAQASGKLAFYNKSLARCGVCGRHDGYWTHSRRSRWHRKGDPNYDDPKVFSGVELKDAFVTIKNHATLGCCQDCFEAVKADLRAALSEVRAALPEPLMGEPPRYQWATLCKCKACTWEGNETELGRLPTLVGYGTYPATCPKCKAGGGLFDRTIDRGPGFVVLSLALPANPSGEPR